LVGLLRISLVFVKEGS